MEYQINENFYFCWSLSSFVINYVNLKNIKETKTNLVKKWWARYYSLWKCMNIKIHKFSQRMFNLAS